MCEVLRVQAPIALWPPGAPGRLSFGDLCGDQGSATPPPTADSSIWGLSPDRALLGTLPIWSLALGQALAGAEPEGGQVGPCWKERLGNSPPALLPSLGSSSSGPSAAGSAEGRPLRTR